MAAYPATIPDLGAAPRECLPMAQKPLVEGHKGKAPLVHARLVPDDFERVQRLAQNRGMSLSQALRYALKTGLDAEDGGHTGQAVA